eukprot:SAG31_NODE_36801_length_310_cov_0.729858_1_plen_93_part_10
MAAVRAAEAEAHELEPLDKGHKALCPLSVFSRGAIEKYKERRARNAQAPVGATEFDELDATAFVTSHTGHATSMLFARRQCGQSSSKPKQRQG